MASVAPVTPCYVWPAGGPGCRYCGPHPEGLFLRLPQSHPPPHHSRQPSLPGDRPASQPLPTRLQQGQGSSQATNVVSKK